MYNLKWHPLPQEKPASDGTYLITRKNFESGAKPIVGIDEYLKSFKCFVFYRSITAWAELPEAYESEDK